MVEREVYFLMNERSGEVMFSGTLKGCEEEAKAVRNKEKYSKKEPLKIFKKTIRTTFIEEV